MGIYGSAANRDVHAGRCGCANERVGTFARQRVIEDDFRWLSPPLLPPPPLRPTPLHLTALTDRDDQINVTEVKMYESVNCPRGK